MGIVSQQLTETHGVYHADNMEVLPGLKTESVDFSVYSPAFPETYAYSNDPRDLSNCTSYREGIDQLRFIVKEMQRVTKPGRLTAVHCMDLKKGSFFQEDFPGDIVDIHEEAGFHFFDRVTIWKDPWLIARRTRMKALRHKNLVEDSATVRTAGADYVLVFKKGGKNAEKIQHPYGLKTYAGAEPLPEDLVQRFANYKGDQRKNFLSHWIWRRYASPVWMDIRSGRLLPFAGTKEHDDEKHICPLQLDVVERCLTLWSNPGDVILTPFMGVGSEVYMSVLMGRKALGVELKETYYRQALKNIERALQHRDNPVGEATLNFELASEELPEEEMQSMDYPEAI